MKAKRAPQEGARQSSVDNAGQAESPEGAPGLKARPTAGAHPTRAWRRRSSLSAPNLNPAPRTLASGADRRLPHVRLLLHLLRPRLARRRRAAASATAAGSARTHRPPAVAASCAPRDSAPPPLALPQASPCSPAPRTPSLWTPGWPSGLGSSRCALHGTTPIATPPAPGGARQLRQRCRSSPAQQWRSMIAVACCFRSPRHHCDPRPHQCFPSSAPVVPHAARDWRADACGARQRGHRLGQGEQNNEVRREKFVSRSRGGG